MLVGHQEVIGALSSQLPPVSIITGPPSVGKRLIAGHAAMLNKVSRVDFMEISRLTVSEATRVKNFMSTEPMQNIKFALIDVDCASNAAVNDLLKALEEPATYARFSIISSTKLPSTLRTRGYKYSVGLLKPSDLQTILISKGLPAEDASSLSALGRVDIALEHYAQAAARSSALTVLDSVLSNDYILFSQAYKAVDDKTAKVILSILQESATQRFRTYNPEYLGAFAQQNVAMAVLAAWSAVSDAKPKLAVRAALESIMKG